MVGRVVHVRSPFTAVAGDAVRALLRDAWGMDVLRLDDVLEGGGAYHWSVDTADGGRWFVTCDDLAVKPWLGGDHDIVFHRLTDAYRTALELRRRGLGFVVAPIASRSGTPAARLDERHSLTVFEHVHGTPGRWGRPLLARHGTELVELLASIHGQTDATPALAPRHLEVPDRAAFEHALTLMDQPWDAGPLAHDARELLRRNLDVVTSSLADLDAAAEMANAMARRVVLTHGEPHAGNLIWTPTGLRLVDWDTVAMAPPERDLWMITHVDPTAAARYQRLTGTLLDEDLLSAHRLLWAIADIASFTTQLHRPHLGNVDDRRALVALRLLLEGDEPAPFIAPPPPT
jgi:spectinomycin phosphotransferase